MKLWLVVDCDEEKQIGVDLRCGYPGVIVNALTSQDALRFASEHIKATGHENVIGDADPSKLRAHELDGDGPIIASMFGAED